MGCNDIGLEAAIMLLIRGDYVWTGDELLTDGAVLCNGDTIEQVGPWETVRAAAPEATVHDGTGHIVVPGLINAHHHGNGVTSFMSGVRDDALEPWLAALATAPSCDPYLDTLWAAIGLLHGGYTTVGLFQTTADPRRAADEARARIRACVDAGLRVAFGLDLIQQNAYVYGPDPAGFPPVPSLSTDAYVALLDALTREFADEPRVRIFAAPSGPQWVTDAAWEAIGAWSKQNRTPLHTHCLESPNEAEYARRTYDGSPVAYLDARGALHEHVSLVHGVYLNESELDLMQHRGASLITNPASNLRLRCGISPVLHALRRDINVALGTDGCTLGERDDAWAEMRLLYYLQRGPGSETASLTWQQPITMATWSAAAVMPWGSRLGALRPGNIADVSLFNYQAAAYPWSHPDINPLELMIQRGSREHTAAVFVAGQLVWDQHRGPLQVSQDATAQKIEELMPKRAPSPEDGWVEDVRNFYKDWPIPDKLPLTPDR